MRLTDVVDIQQVFRIKQRLKSIEIRKDLTDEFANLTDIIYKTWADKTAKEYKKFKGLKKENLRDT